MREFKYKNSMRNIYEWKINKYFGKYDKFNNKIKNSLKMW